MSTIRSAVALVAISFLGPQLAVAAEPAMDPQMEAIIKAGTPGAAHARLAEGAGRWKMSVTSWPAPGAPPQVSMATATREMILGGRYLKETVIGDWGGMPFEGQGLLGYDNVDKSYYSTWIDNFSTGVMTQKGTCDAAHKRCEFKGTANDPVSGKQVNSRTVVLHPDPDHEVVEMYGPGPDGKEFKLMELKSERVPAAK
jgi:hypothetical protein